MTWQQIIEKFVTDVSMTTWQEWVSTISQVASVWYARKNNILVYPTGIVGVVLAAWIYFFVASPPLYADGLLNIYYFLMSVYGWYNWGLKSREQNHIYPISRCTPSELRYGIGGFLVAWLILYLLLIKVTNSNTPVLDSLVSSSAVTAMWWMARRKIENWHAWILSNLVAIPLNFYKGLMLFTLMYILFLFLAYTGLKEWKKNAL